MMRLTSAPFRMSLHVAYLLVATSLLLDGSSTARAQVTTGSLEIQITGPNNRPLDGVEVSALGVGLPHSQVSNQAGRAVIPALPPGIYRVGLRRIGYRAIVVDQVRVRLGETTTLDRIHLDAVTSDLPEVTILADRPLIDVTSPSSSVTLDASTYDNLPLPRSYNSIATLVAHNNVSFLGDNVSVAGGTGLENNYFIDGVNAADVLGTRTLGTRLPYNFIKEVQVRTGGYEAEYRSALGGVLNVITHEGTDSLEGQVFAFGSHNKLAASREESFVQAHVRNAYAADAGVGIGGPLRRGSLWFFGAYNPSIESAEKLLPGLGYYRSHETVHSYAAKLTWRPASPTAVSFSAFGDPSSKRGVADTFGAYGPPVGYANPDPALGDIRRGGNAQAVDVRHTISRRVLLDGSVSRLSTRDDNMAATEKGDDEWMFDNDGIRSGGYPERVSYDATRTTLGLNATLLHERHVSKIGLSYVDNALDQNVRMRSVSVIDAGMPLYGFFLSGANGRVRSRIPGVYAQDSWSATERLRVSFGLRWDGQLLLDSKGRTAVTILDQYQPRLGIVYQPGKSGGEKVFATFGRFYQDLHLAASGLYQDFSNVFYLGTCNHDLRNDASLCGAQNLAGGVWDEGIRGQYNDELTAGYEHQLTRSAKAGMRLIARRLRNGIEDAFDADSGRFVVGNPGRGSLSEYPHMKRSYTALELSAEGAASTTVKFLGSYVLSRTQGNYSGLFDLDFGYLFPNRNGEFDFLEIVANNSVGDLPNDRRHVLKLASIVRAPANITASAFALVASGTPVSELGGSPVGFPYATFLSKRGTAGRTPAIVDMSFRLARDIGGIGSSTRSTILLDVFHVGTRQKPVSFDQRRYLAVDDNGQQAAPNPTYGLPTAFAPAVSARFGAVVRF